MKLKVIEFFNQLLPVLQIAEQHVTNLIYMKSKIYDELAIIKYTGYRYDVINISCNSLSATLRAIVTQISTGDCIGHIVNVPEELQRKIEEVI